LNKTGLTESDTVEDWAWSPDYFSRNFILLTVGIIFVGQDFQLFKNLMPDLEGGAEDTCLYFIWSVHLHYNPAGCC